jgi:hypothetical protein
LSVNSAYRQRKLPLKAMYDFPNDFRRNKMETQETGAKIRTANAVAHIIRTIGVLFYIAMAFSLEGGSS